MFCYTSVTIPDTVVKNNKQLLDEVFVMSRIIKVEVRVISQAEGEADNSY